MATPPSPTKIQPTKLRDSCNACAVSKLKCSKEKPECARCAKRGHRCEYFATRRAGRRHEPRPRQQDDGTKTSTSDDSSDVQSSVHVAVPARSDAANHLTPPWDTDIHMSDDTTVEPSLSGTLSLDGPTLAGDDAASWRMLAEATMPDAPDMFASFQMTSHLFITGVDNGGSKDLANIDKEGFDFGDFTGFLAPNSTTLVLDETAFDGVDEFRLSSPWDSPSSPSLASLSSSMSPSLTTSSVLTAATTQHPSVSNSPTEARCLAPPAPVPATPALAPPAPVPAVSPLPPTTSTCCLIRAMELLPTLFSPSAACTCQSLPPSGSHLPPVVDPAPPTTEQAVTKNKQTLDSLQAMLDCPCSTTSNNSYLLAIISLAILKVLAWYRAAAVPPPPVAHLADDGRQRGCHAEHVVLSTPAVVDAYRLDGDDDRARMAAQLVLSELHRVQRLVNVLSGRLQQQQQQQLPGEGGGGFFSVAWFGQLEGDLRRRVRGLSLEIVDLLRQ